jgi:pyrroline-5-carboxylate reductase
MQIGFIGGGQMAEAIIAGLIQRDAAKPDEILAADVSAERRALLQQRYAVQVTPDNAAVIQQRLLVLLAVKPQILEAVLKELAPHVTLGHVVVSIAAGKRTAFIESFLPRGRIIRVMPNLACQVGAGMNVFTRGTRTLPADAATVARVLACCGEVAELPEAQFDAVTALSGSGPAFFAYVLDRLAEGAVAEGLKPEDARRLAAQTMYGTALLLLEKRFDPAALSAAVTSAKGTTAAGRAVLETPAVAEILRQTVRAAAARSRELGRG